MGRALGMFGWGLDCKVIYNTLRELSVIIPICLNSSCSNLYLSSWILRFLTSGHMSQSSKPSPQENNIMMIWLANGTITTWAVTSKTADRGKNKFAVLFHHLKHVVTYSKAAGTQYMRKVHTFGFMPNERVTWAQVYLYSAFPTQQ